MPFKSLKQEAYFNANKGKSVPADVVDEFNEASKGMKLPAKVKNPKMEHKSMEPKKSLWLKMDK